MPADSCDTTATESPAPRPFARSRRASWFDPCIQLGKRTCTERLTPPPARRGIAREVRDDHAACSAAARARSCEPRRSLHRLPAPSSFPLVARPSDRLKSPVHRARIDLSSHASRPLLALVEQDAVEKAHLTGVSTRNPSRRSRTRYNVMSCDTHRSSCGRTSGAASFSRITLRDEFRREIGRHHHVGDTAPSNHCARNGDLTRRRRSSRDTSSSDRARRRRRALRPDDAASFAAESP